MSRASRRELIQELRERLRRLEHSHRPAQEEVFSTGTALDRLLPEKGLARGMLIEWLSDGEGAGAATLALAVAAGLLKSGGCFVVLDGKREFYPPAAAGLGIPLEYTVVVQPQNAGDALWALEQALRSRAVAVALSWIERLSDRQFRRLQLASEKGGSLGFLIRPACFRVEPSWADVRFLVAHAGVTASPTPLSSSGRRLHVEVLHCRGRASGEAIELELNHETDPVRLVSSLANPALPPRAAGA